MSNLFQKFPVLSLFILALTSQLNMTSAKADLVFLNSGFEDAGINPDDSANWIEDGLPSSASRRSTSMARTGIASHHLGGIAVAGAGDGSVIQNTLDVGLPSLSPGDRIVAEFWALASFDVGASAVYQLDIVNSAGSVVASTGQIAITDTQSDWQVFDTRSQPLQVPQFSVGDNSAFGAQLSIEGFHNGAPSTVSYNVFVDDVSLISVPEPQAAMVLATGLLGMFFRRRIGPR